MFLQMVNIWFLESVDVEKIDVFDILISILEYKPTC